MMFHKIGGLHCRQNWTRNGRFGRGGGSDAVAGTRATFCTNTCCRCAVTKQLLTLRPQDMMCIQKVAAQRHAALLRPRDDEVRCDVPRNLAPDRLVADNHYR
jgi:hypothetical protein